MTKYKLLHLTSSLKIGGAETLLCDIIRNLDSNLFDNHVIYFHSGPNVKKIKDLGVATYQIKGLLCMYDPVFFLRLFLLIRKLKPDFIHSLLWAANFSGTLIAKLLNIPIVCALHLASNVETKNKNSFFRNILDRHTFLSCQKLITVSENTLNELTKSYEWIPAEKISVIKNGVDIEFVLNQAKTNYINPNIFGIKKDDFILGSVGRLIQRKNHQLILEAVCLIKDKCPRLKLIFVGDGIMYETLKQKAQDLNIQDRVIFTSCNQAYSFYNIFNAFVLVSYQEGLSIALLEAMCFKLPCIVTGENKNHEVIRSDYNGIVIEQGDKFELAMAIEKLYQDKNLSRNLGMAGNKTIIEDYRFTTMIKKYSDLFITLSSRK